MHLEKAFFFPSCLEKTGILPEVYSMLCFSIGVYVLAHVESGTILWHAGVGLWQPQGCGPFPDTLLLPHSLKGCLWAWKIEPL